MSRETDDAISRITASAFRVGYLAGFRDRMDGLEPDVVRAFAEAIHPTSASVFVKHWDNGPPTPNSEGEAP